ncbi:MAG: hypothetical protein WBC71_01590 [Salaquimonas sp.]
MIDFKRKFIRPAVLLTALSGAPLLLSEINYGISQALADSTKKLTEDELFEKLSNAKTEFEGRDTEFQIWEYWTAQAPSDEIRAKLTRGMQKRRESDFPWSEDLFDEVIKAAPEYAEGWNQRGFVRFLRGNLEGALSDLEKTVELEPRHFGALSGMYHVLRLLNRSEAAIRSLHMAVTIHPWLKERNDLPEKLRPKKIPVQEL